MPNKKDQIICTTELTHITYSTLFTSLTHALRLKWIRQRMQHSTQLINYQKQKKYHNFLQLQVVRGVFWFN